ncbi:DUF6270 domain-containing protein [Glutamicibacter ardleyensis]|uniref:Uncharacterized protein n=1 Tax=Glutamicibacter ardleyensis TaxID=225894 RepID=A0ABQ2DN38_9MICC|nr:DUF6270 domain-containing protein [Glutamicibacter ardleyensis]GGJ60425.1 hypothetical protein GCM10007173_19030 [Glutamicibacter ardleyensis]
MTGNLFVYGGPVARDTASALVDVGFEEIGSVMRQSVISAFSEPGAAGTDIEHSIANLRTEKQRKLLVSDINSSLPAELRSQTERIDCLLMDLVDERDGTWTNNIRQAVTNSSLLTESRLLQDGPNDFRLLKFGEEDHVNEYRKAIEKFSLFIHQEKLSEKLFIICNYWTSESREGESHPFGNSRLDPEIMNSLYPQYYGVLEEHFSSNMIYVPKNLCLTSREHQFGASPFTYTGGFYKYLTDKIIFRKLGTTDGIS